MKTIKIKISLYEYKELTGEAKEKAFEDQRIFLYNNPQEYEDKNGLMKLDNMDEWTEENIKEYVEDCINANEYLYFVTGEMADTIHYFGKHEKAGITEFKFQGLVYKI